MLVRESGLGKQGLAKGERQVLSPGGFSLQTGSWAGPPTSAMITQGGDRALWVSK